MGDRDQIITREYLTLKDLASYSGLCVRSLRGYLKDSSHPLPCFRVNRKKILVRRTEFDIWLEQFRAGRDNEVDALVSEFLTDMERQP